MKPGIKLKVICVDCESEYSLTLKNALYSIIEFAEKENSFGGFLCLKCGKAADYE